MNEIRDENRWTDPETGIRYKTNDGTGCDGCAISPPACPRYRGGPFCDDRRSDGRDVIWIHDDQPVLTAASDSAPDGTVSVRLGAPLP